MRSFLPQSEFELSALPEMLDVEQTLTERRQVHTAFATTLLTVDTLGHDGGERQDALKGLVQAWDYLARQHGEDVHVEYVGQPWRSLSTDITDRDSTDVPVRSNAQYGVLNTERDVLLKLGSFGPMLTSSREKAAKQARGGDHLDLVQVTTIPVSQQQSGHR